VTPFRPPLPALGSRSGWSRLLRPEGRFARRLLGLSGGTAASQLLVVAAAPLLTRIYTPAEFGAFTAFMALVSIFGPVSALRYELSIPLADGLHRARVLTALSTLAVLATFGLSLSVVAALRTVMPGIAGALPGPAGAPWLVPAAMLLYGLAQPLAFLSIRQDGVRLSSLTLIAQSACQVALQCGLGLLGLGAGGLILGSMSGHLLRLLRLAWAVKGGLRADLAGSGPEIAAAAREHWRQPALSTPAGLLRLSAQFLPALLFAALYGPVAAGLFGLGQRLLTTPVRMLGQAAGQAFLVEAADRDRRSLHRLFVRTTRRFLVVGLAWALPLLVLGPWLFARVFGPEWREAGEMVRLLVPLHLARFVVVPVSQALSMARRHDADLALAAVLALAVLGSFALGRGLDLGPLAVVALYSASSTTALLLTLLVAWRTVLAGAREQEGGREAARGP
jgi:O-antigen/teichoic acid export membrane protein